MTTPTIAHKRDGITYLPIDEWIRRYGRPGNGGAPDANGRYSGYFATEPCFCEDDTKDTPCRN